MPWITVNGNHVLIGEDDGGGPSKTEKAVQKAKQGKLTTCRECGRKVVPRGRDVCERKECRDSFGRGLKQWHRMYGIGKKDLPAILGVKKYRGNPHAPKTGAS